MSERERAGESGRGGRGAEEVATVRGGRIGVRHGNLLRERIVGGDVSVCFGGKIAVTLIKLL